jgi:uncharacterized membrane protein
VTEDAGTKPRSVLAPAILLGIGLGGLLDGIVLHQILQWHHVLSSDGCCPTSTVAGLKDNTLADGVFQLTMWIVAVAGTAGLVSAWREGGVAPSGRAVAGGLLVGWGIFGLIDSASHYILGLHHVRDDLGGPAGWDIGFLFFALAVICAGAALISSAGAARAGKTG